MTTGRRSTDWLSGPPVEETASDERCGRDRRAGDRRAPRRRLDPMFAATLVNQVAPAETKVAPGYQPPVSQTRRGVVINLRV